ncbi:MAG: hypothetical protein WCJ33_01195, partial [Pseudomonadota bacterium]
RKAKEYWVNSEVPEYHDITPKLIPPELEAVGNEKSTLADIKQIETEYFRRQNVFNNIGWADVEQLKTSLEQYKEAGLDIKSVFETSDKIGNAIEDDRKDRRIEFFDSPYLYNDSKSFNNVLDTLRFIKQYSEQHEIPKVQVAGLTACAARQLESHLERTKNQEELANSGIILINFAKELLNSATSAEQPEMLNAIREDFTRLLNTMMKIEERAKKTQPEFRLEGLHAARAFKRQLEQSNSLSSPSH